MLVIYGIKSGVKIWKIPQYLTGLLLLCIPIALSFLSVLITSFLKPETIDGCKEFDLADNDFLPTYLGYFFVSLSISDSTTIVYLYLIVFVFTFLSQTQYFNPIFLLFGYHYYHVLTKHGTRVFVIIKGEVIRNKKNISFDNLKRLNDSTYIQRKEKRNEYNLCKIANERKDK